MHKSVGPRLFVVTGGKTADLEQQVAPLASMELEVEQSGEFEARERSQGEADPMIQEMALDQLRGALDLTQEHLAELP